MRIDRTISKRTQKVHNEVKAFFIEKHKQGMERTEIYPLISERFGYAESTIKDIVSVKDAKAQQAA